MNEPISPEKIQSVLALLESIEKEYEITIVHAVESGSRAWGFPSIDSDFDVRFIYFHKPDWYVTPFDRKDTIDVSAPGDLDAGGWDIGKCLSLLYKGNVVLQEWLNSPIVYKSDPTKHQLLAEFAAREFNPAAAFYHYISLAKRKFLDESTATNAKYFLYGLRSVLCAKHISECRTVPPVLFDSLVESYLSNSKVLILRNILTRKNVGGEKDKIKIENDLWDFVMELFNSLQNEKFGGHTRSSPEVYAAFMREFI